MNKISVFSNALWVRTKALHILYHLFFGRRNKMDAISKMWMQSSAGQRALAERMKKEDDELVRWIKERIYVASSFFTNIDQSPDKESFFSVLQSLYDTQETISEEKRQYFLNFGINIKEDYFPPSKIFGKV